MRDVAAPLYRFFLADAQAAARAGDAERVLECLGLALDFAPESQRERVLLAAAELVPPAVGAGVAGAGGPGSAAPAKPLVVQLVSAASAPRPQGRIAWEDRVAPPVLREEYRISASLTAPAAQPRSGSRGLRRLAVVAGVLTALTAAGLRFGWVPAGAADALRGDPVERAALALESGDAGVALQLLEPLGEEAPARVWLLRASAHEALADTSAAVAALAAAASRDAEGGRWALEAGDRLGRLGAVLLAADAYLYAVAPSRTDAELDRIARMQERAGHVDRARRVRWR
ncbi:MAG TPA: hypothetical protein VF006_12960 [Longimicrobium sp.]